MLFGDDGRDKLEASSGGDDVLHGEAGDDRLKGRGPRLFPLCPRRNRLGKVT
ncbi:hypothetical protein [Jannaschia faecimaris]|uniref:hypothetical protein n=1 Tax=Jannaschia faecimaris TaxID=1244108 RepID=UPI001480A6C4|nr:hypothetical protein [Jannaschia faecimaris]